MRWFGPDGYSSAAGLERCETPVGETCYQCEIEFFEDDVGYEFPYIGVTIGVLYAHRACFLESILGPDWKAKTKELVESELHRN